MLGLLQSGPAPVLADLGVTLAVGHTGHGQIHANLGALALEVGAQALDDLRINALGYAHDMLGGPGHLALLLHKLVGADAALGALLRGGLALVDVTADAANKLFHDSGSSLLLFC